MILFDKDEYTADEKLFHSLSAQHQIELRQHEELGYNRGINDVMSLKIEKKERRKLFFKLIEEFRNEI